MTHKEIIQHLNKALKKLNIPDVKVSSGKAKEISNKDFINYIGVRFGVRSDVYLPQVGAFIISMN